MHAHRPSFARSLLVLGIESSCDETAAALVSNEGEILAQAIASQEAAHAPYGGVVPEIAARAHAERLTPLIEQVLAQAGKNLADCDAIAATAGPGLIGGVMVGLVTAKALALASGRALHAINHLEGHALSPRLADRGLRFPYALLLVSGGHCQILEVGGPGRYRRHATTIDDALGEAFDKTAKILGLGYPGGPAVEALARSGDGAGVPLPRPMVGRSEPHFSFAGLKSAVLRARECGDYADADIAASFQQAAIDCLVDRTGRALAAMSRSRGDAGARAGFAGGDGRPGGGQHEGGFGPPTALVVAGGVAANKAVRAALERLAARCGLPFCAPPLALCTDNAAMIAWAAIEHMAAGKAPDHLDFPARPRWPLDPTAAPARGAGIKA